jgi:hypothetical protein
MRKYIRHPVALLAVLGVLALAVGVGSDLVEYYARAVRMHYATSPMQLIATQAFESMVQIWPNRDKGLTPVRMYLSEKAQKRLLGDLPMSTKQWQAGKLVYPDDRLRAVKIRFRGDNPRNYLDFKKSWRIKTKKKKIFGQRRILNFVAPRAHIIDEIIPFKISRMLGLLTPGVRLIELFVNDKPHGVMIDIEQPDESFLRSHATMPANLYKGPGSRDVFVTGVSSENLFENPRMWSKIATGNALDPDAQSDLASLLRLISQAGGNAAAMRRLRDLAPIDLWARFGAMQILTQSWHNNQRNNQRLLFDQWRGEVVPIVWDTGYQYDWRSLPKPKLDNDSHILFRHYQMCSDFLLTEYRYVYSALTEMNMMQVIGQELRAQEAALSNSIARDAAYQSFVLASNGTGFASGSGKLERSRIIDSLGVLRRKLLAEIGGVPQAGWRQQGKKFTLVVDGIPPLGSVSLRLASNRAMPNRIVLDLDNDGRATTSDIEIPFTIDKGQIILDAVWLANRVPRTRAGSLPAKFVPAMTGYGMATQGTGFSLLFDPAPKIVAVSAANLFSGSQMDVPPAGSKGVDPHQCNRPIIAEPRPNTVVWQGDMEISENTLIEAPTRIVAGTNIRIAADASLIFLNRLEVDGTLRHPVRIGPAGGQPWGGLALKGIGTAGSRIRNLRLQGGSGGGVGQVRYTGMLSIHDTRDIEIDGLTMLNNVKFDDLIHVVYSNEIALSNLQLDGAVSDALDIDISNVVVENARITRSGGDAIDLMDSTVNLINVAINGANDKGISVGEASDAVAFNLRIENAAIGIESKDKASIQIYNADFVNNRVHLNAYTKNWRYGGGGRIHVARSYFAGVLNVVTAAKNSQIEIANSTVSSEVHATGSVTLASDVEVGSDRNSSNTKLPAEVLSRLSGIKQGEYERHRGMVK